MMQSTYVCAKLRRSMLTCRWYCCAYAGDVFAGSRVCFGKPRGIWERRYHHWRSRGVARPTAGIIGFKVQFGKLCNWNMKKSCRCEPLSQLLGWPFPCWCLGLGFDVSHCEIACRCLSGKPWLGAFGWSIIVMCFLLDPGRRCCYLVWVGGLCVSYNPINHHRSIREMFRHYQWTHWTLESIKSNNDSCRHSLHSNSLTTSIPLDPLKCRASYLHA